ncbi:hypothetical protein [Anabaena azotica]|uniref:hypothetical protein n=1 Tax=Anabaena azotica TaxID=197653 RepID=UPI001687AB46|nr:hypothetical protein [Anabaena azotica]
MRSCFTEYYQQAVYIKNAIAQECGDRYLSKSWLNFNAWWIHSVNLIPCKVSQMLKFPS